MKINDFEYSPAGYTYILDKLELTGIPNWHTSFVSSYGIRKSTVQDRVIEDIYPLQYWPGDAIGDHLEFALKYDGTNLSLLSQIFAHVKQEQLVEYISSRPTGKYARRIWFFYEFLTNKQLPLDNLTSGNYVDALERNKYYTIQNSRKSQRHRIVNNLLGSRKFCPIVRKTKKLAAFDATDLHQRCQDIVASYPADLIRRALSYFYNKETKSSFEIEHITPNASRTEKFIQSLELAEKEDFLTKRKLIELQNHIVDSRFKDEDYRNTQNYIGQTVKYQKEIIHFICPRPNDVPELMEGLIESHNIMTMNSIPAIIHAAIISYGFVFMHPFEDGNGRIHRFLIHNILSLRKIVPNGLMFPVSAVMLKDQADYDAALESFSRPLLQLIDYQLDQMGQMTVNNDTSCWYKYIDITFQAEALYEFVTRTIEEELIEELNFLSQYDQTKQSIQNIIDMPDRKIDLFIQLCLQNNGKLSANKQSKYFNFLTEEELMELEQVVKKHYNPSE